MRREYSVLVSLATVAVATIPEPLLYRLLIHRRARLWRKAGIVFVHVPKNGGTSMCASLFGRPLGHIPATAIMQFADARIRRLPSFAITRNPWARTLSAYRFARAGVTRDGARIQRPRQYGRGVFDSFPRFVHEWLPHQDLSHADPVFRPQCAYICHPDGSRAVSYVGRLENLTGVGQFIRSHGIAFYGMGCLNQTGAADDYRDHYSPEMRRLVGRVYARDIEEFGYTF